MNVRRHSGDLGESWYVGGNAGSFRSWVEHYPRPGRDHRRHHQHDVPATGIVDALAHEAVAAAPPTALGRCNTDIAVRSADGSRPAGHHRSRLRWLPGVVAGRVAARLERRCGTASRTSSSRMPTAPTRSRLTDDAAQDLFPRWSPDGASIAFTSDRDGDLEIYLIAPDGSDVRQLTDDDGDEWLPAWSPDGTQIAYVSERRGAAHPGDGCRWERRPGGDLGSGTRMVADLVAGRTSNRLRVGRGHLHRASRWWRTSPPPDPADPRHDVPRLGTRVRTSPSAPTGTSMPPRTSRHGPPTTDRHVHEGGGPGLVTRWVVDRVPAQPLGDVGRSRAESGQWPDQRLTTAAIVSSWSLVRRACPIFQGPWPRPLEAAAPTRRATSGVFRGSGSTGSSSAWRSSDAIRWPRPTLGSAWLVTRRKGRPERA